MNLQRGKIVKGIFWIGIIAYMFIATTPNEEKLKGLEAVKKDNKIYKETYAQLVDLKGNDDGFSAIQKDIDKIRESFEKMKQDESYDEDLQKTINTWSSETDKIQSSMVVELDSMIDALKEKDADEYKESLKYIEDSIKALIESPIEYPQSQGKRLQERLENLENK